jgi:hypothetical protein
MKLENIYKGVMFDVSRGQVLKLKLLKKIIPILAENKINFISLYIEHTFEFEKHPIIWKNTGSYSKKEIKELIEFCRRYGIEVIPSIQTFGHFEKILRHKEYASLAESEMFYSLSPVKNEIYNLLEDIIKEISETFESEYINIGCDEIWDLGKGESLKLVKKLGGVENIFINHILKVKSICEKYNKKIMMWGDMLLNYKKISKGLPKDIIILNWYYEDAQIREFKRRIIYFYKNKYIQFICPGCSNWATLFPEIEKAENNIKNFIKTSLKYKNVNGFMLTSWGDDNNFNFLSEALPQIIYFANFVRDFRIDEKIFNSQLCKILGLKNEINLNKILIFFGSIYKILNFESCHKFFYRFWEKKVLIEQDNFKDLNKITELYKESQNLINSLKGSTNNLFLKEILYKMNIIKFYLLRILSDNVIVMLYLKSFIKFWEEENVNKNLKSIINISKNLFKEVILLRRGYIKLWRKSYRGEGLKYNIERFLNIENFYKNYYKLFKRILKLYNRRGGGLPKPEEIFKKF